MPNYDQAPDLWADDPAEFTAPAVPESNGRLATMADRLREAAANPELRRQVAEVVMPYGEVALRGAMEGSGVTKVDKEGRVKVKKLGAIKAVMRPGHTLRKATQGAVRETRAAVQADVMDYGRQAVTNHLAGSSHPEAVQTYAPTAPLESAPPDIWESPQAPNMPLGPPPEADIWAPTTYPK